MRKSYSLIFVLCLYSFGLKAQLADVILDRTHLSLTMTNIGTRAIAAQTEDEIAKKNLDSYNKMVKSHAAILVVQKRIEESLFNVNSALKNSLAIKDIGTQISNIYGELNNLLNTCNKYPQYSFLGKKYIEYATQQAIALNEDVQKFALSGSNNIMMNYRERDQVIRDVQVRLGLIRANLQLITITLNRASKIGFLKAATPFGNWINNDMILVKDIIKRSKFLTQ